MEYELSGLSETDVREFLADAIAEGTGGEARTQSFADAGVLTTNEGIVLRLPDGREFQITVVRSA